jgi:hypothetical protein
MAQHSTLSRESSVPANVPERSGRMPSSDRRHVLIIAALPSHIEWSTAVYDV